MNIETIIEGRMWIVRNMIPKELCKHVAMEYHMMKDVIKWQYPNADLGDPTMPGAWSMYCPVCFEALGQYQQPIVEKIIGIYIILLSIISIFNVYTFINYN